MAILNPKDEVLVYEPAWVSFTEQIRLAYGIPVHIPYDETIYNFEKYITDKTKMIIINNPNNPTGKVYSLEELSYLYQYDMIFLHVYTVFHEENNNKDHMHLQICVLHDAY